MVFKLEIYARHDTLMTIKTRDYYLTHNIRIQFLCDIGGHKIILQSLSPLSK